MDINEWEYSSDENGISTTQFCNVQENYINNNNTTQFCDFDQRTAECIAESLSRILVISPDRKVAEEALKITGTSNLNELMKEVEEKLIKYFKKNKRSSYLKKLVFINYKNSNIHGQKRGSNKNSPKA